MALFERFRKKKQQEAIFCPSKQKGDVEAKNKGKAEIKTVNAGVNAEATTKVQPSAKTAAAYKIIESPVISEKATIGESYGVYTFFVARSATKPQVKQAVKKLYGVLPRQVRLINVQGKHIRFGRTAGRRKDRKKAIVTLPAGTTMSIHESV